MSVQAPSVTPAQAPDAGSRQGGLARHRNAVTGYAFLAPFLLFYAVFLLYPFALGLWMSLHDWEIVGDFREYIGFANYVELWEDPVLLGGPQAHPAVRRHDGPGRDVAGPGAGPGAPEAAADLRRAAGHLLRLQHLLRHRRHPGVGHGAQPRPRPHRQRPARGGPHAHRLPGRQGLGHAGADGDLPVVDRRPPDGALPRRPPADPPGGSTRRPGWTRPRGGRC